MTNEVFMAMVESRHQASKQVLCKKEKEYSSGKNRLEQFYRAASVQNINPCEALVGMMTKHFTSIVDCSKTPLNTPDEMWKEKLTDLRNYSYLLEALVVDMKNLYMEEK